MQEKRSSKRGISIKKVRSSKSIINSKIIAGTEGLYDFISCSASALPPDETGQLVKLIRRLKVSDACHGRRIHLHLHIHLMNPRAGHHIHPFVENRSEEHTSELQSRGHLV